ncbi:GNAT family N-acetyltransferase [Providencia stuartii]|uniref:Acetyltransferase n=2 Tax=Providencia TaxID=586 RepID=A0A1S1HPD9_PROST|nr:MULTISPECIES: GNAT family N-acetyltransferase [Providencia]MDV5224781.1 GNAT family N-acetyltransferase [Providencia rettgeri]ELR5302119.1 GNAT family N-acetyltransferase [Providencia stuartii]MDW7590618.1 GNAT family N-acetyltransferase [Providencia sp. 2023EL-00965]MDX4945157.1 GNAT family N-acetyltransferase [Providencia manganoxydans]OHT24125.1 acetyltransferase [Providencia stuartii]
MNHFRLATPQDIDGLIEIDSIKTHERALKIAQWVADKNCYLIEQETQIYAYAVLHYHFFDFGFIEMLMVSKQFRRLGLGVELINQLKLICTTSKLFTSTNQSNTAMQALLNHTQFLASGVIENLDDDDPELIYVCKLID